MPRLSRYLKWSLKSLLALASRLIQGFNELLTYTHGIMMSDSSSIVSAKEMKYSRLNQPPTSSKFNRRVLCAILLIALTGTVFYYFRFHGFDPVPAVSFTVWPKFEHKPHQSQDWFQQNCFKNDFLATLGSLEHNLQQWKASADDYCREIYKAFNSMYYVAFRAGTIVVPPEFQPQVSGWLKNDPDLMKEVYDQKVIHLYNNYGREHIVFSPLRAKRPQKKPEVDPLEYVKKNVEETKQNCDFCNYKTHTSEDTFGRIITNHSVSAANTFKVDRWHSLIIPKRHNPIELTEEETVDMFRAAVFWMEKVHSLEKEFKYPWLLWDSMPHAGASQTHPHIHVGLYPDMYVGIAEGTRRGAELYVGDYTRDYFTDLTSIHHVLGLTVTLGEATAMAQLTSKKDTEITIISPTANTDLFRLVYYTTKAFMDMGYYDLSSLMVFPVLDAESTDGSLPAIIRISSRGDVSTVKSEISSFELYQFSNINVDPYVVIKALRNSVSSRIKDSPFTPRVK